jgi:hypothetical protein
MADLDHSLHATENDAMNALSQRDMTRRRRVPATLGANPKDGGTNHDNDVF